MKLDKAFPPTPKAFENAFYAGIKEGKKRMKMRNKLRLSALAACLVVCLFVIAYAAGTGDRTDNTSASSPESSEISSSTIIGGADEATSIILVAATPSPTPENAPYPRDNSTQEQAVYMTEHGVYYHNDPTCSGMINAFMAPISEAREEDKLPCPICVGETVYATANGKWYHSDPYCQGMQNAGEWSIINAEANGKLPCPVCMSDRSIDMSNYHKRALEVLEEIFPGCVDVIEKHYNVDQLYTQPSIERGVVHVDVSANAVTVASIDFDGDDKKVMLFFNDVEISRKILACSEEDTLSDKLNDLHTKCKDELLSGVLSAIHGATHSWMPVSAEAYNLRSLNLTFSYEECQNITYNYTTKYNHEASFTFELVEGDALSNMTFLSQ